MSKARPLGCLIATSLTLTVAVILLITSAIFVYNSSLTRAIVSQLYALSLYSLVISVLAIIICIGFLYVVVRQYPALTALFSGLLIFIAFLAVICGVILITGRTELQHNVQNRTTAIVSNYSDTEGIKSSKPTIARIQHRLRCCGINSPSDWKSILPDGKSVPDSCCIQSSKGCGKDALFDTKNLYVRGCSATIFGRSSSKYDALIGMNFTLVVLALIGAVLGIVYERYIREQYQSV